MNVKELLDQMIELCELDGALHELRTQLALYPKMLAELEARETALKKRIASADKVIEETRLTRRKSELDVKTERERITKYVVQQNQVKSQKEYDAITQQIAAVREKIDELDLVGLEALEHEEVSTEEKQSALETQQSMTRENAAERERIKTQTAQKKERLAELEKERSSRFDLLPEELKESYELLNARFPGGALATVSEGHCSGCGMTLIKHLAQDVRMGEKLTRCEGCMRILHA